MESENPSPGQSSSTESLSTTSYGISYQDGSNRTILGDRLNTLRNRTTQPKKEDTGFTQSIPGKFPAEDEPPEVKPEVKSQPQASKSEEDDDKTCRICFSGEDPEMGRLFSPCLCKGTSRYVHVNCLNMWRNASKGSAFFKCDQCGYEYKLSRTVVAKIVQNPVTITTLTIILFTLLVFISGYLANGLIALVNRVDSYSSFFYSSDYLAIGGGVRDAVDLLTNIFEQVTDEFRAPSARSLPLRGTRRNPAKNMTPTWVKHMINHMAKGLSLIGITTISHTFIYNLIIQGTYGFGRFFRPTRRRDGQQGASPIQVVMLILVVLGTIKAFTSIYRYTQFTSKRLLKRMEAFVLDV